MILLAPTHLGPPARPYRVWYLRIGGHTPQEIEEILREGYRRMPPIEKLDRETMIAAFGWDPEVEGY
jgi:hypothetical protein